MNQIAEIDLQRESRLFFVENLRPDPRNCTDYSVWSCFNQTIESEQIDLCLIGTGQINRGKEN